MFNNTQRTEAKRNTGCRNKVRGQRHIRQLLGATAESLASVLPSLYVCLLTELVSFEKKKPFSC